MYVALIVGILIGLGTSSICFGIVGFILFIVIDDCHTLLQVIARNVAKSSEELEKIRKNSELK